MDWVEVCSRVVLAATFLAAGASKFRDLDGVAQTARHFGLPARLVPASRVGVPALEVAIAAGILVTGAARVSAGVALVLLGAFSVAIGRVLAAGREVPCRCFGAASAEPVGRAALARNAGLMVLAAIVASGPAVSLPSWFADRSGSELAILALAFTVAAQGVLNVRLWRAGRSARDQDAQTPPPLVRGERLPQVAVHRADGSRVGGRELHAERPAVFVFVSDGCGPCVELKPDLAAWQAALAGEVAVHVLTDSAPPHEVPGPDGPVLLYDPQGLVQRACRVPATPSAFAIDVGGRVTHGTVSGPVAVEALIRTV